MHGAALYSTSPTDSRVINEGSGHLSRACPSRPRQHHNAHQDVAAALGGKPQAQSAKPVLDELTVTLNAKQLAGRKVLK
jgi:hypothetical protein